MLRIHESLKPKTHSSQNSPKSISDKVTSKAKVDVGNKNTPFSPPNQHRRFRALFLRRLKRLHNVGALFELDNERADPKTKTPNRTRSLVLCGSNLRSFKIPS